MPTIAAAQVQRASYPAYQYVQPALADMVALGRRAIITYGGLVLNDRLRPDRYLIETIDGLGGADVRDGRTVKPSDHGELPYDSFVGGKTITFSGRMEAGNLWELGRMERDLRAALGTLTESPLKFNWWDSHDGFFDPLGLAAFWTAFSGGPLTINNGVCTFLAGGGVAYRNARQLVDARVTARWVTAAPAAQSSVGVIAKCASNQQYLQTVATVAANASVTLYLQKVVGGITTTLASQAATFAQSGLTTLTAGQSLWVQLQTVGDVVTVFLYSQDPTLYPSQTAAATASTTLLGNDADTFGDSQQGYAGAVLAETGSQTWALLDHRVDAIYPCDMQVMAKAVTDPSFKDPGMATMSRFRQDFQFALRASNPRIMGPNRVVVSVPILGSTSTQPTTGGRGYPKSYLYGYIVGSPPPPSPTQLAPALVRNLGSWYAQPVIVIGGGITNPVLIDLTTGERLVLNGTISTGDYVTLNVAQAAPTLLNSAGASVYGMYDPTSAMLQVPPGDSYWLLTGQNVVGSPYCTVSFAHTWR